MEKIPIRNLESLLEGTVIKFDCEPCHNCGY